MDNTMVLIILLFLVFIILFINDNQDNQKNKNNIKENFKLLFYESSPSTRNMSYDLRCEPKIPKKDTHFFSSSIQPYYRERCLNL